MRLDIYVRFGRPLGSGQLGRGTLAGRGTACVRALLVHGSFAVQTLEQALHAAVHQLLRQVLAAATTIRTCFETV